MVYDKEPPEETPGAEVPKCPTCGRATDDIADMSEAALLEVVRLGTLQMLARQARGGELTHQELTVIARVLKDNDRALKPLAPVAEGEKDAALPSGRRTKLSTPSRRQRPEFPEGE